MCYNETALHDVDGTEIKFCKSYDDYIRNNISIGSSHVNDVAVSWYKYIEIENDKLHRWEDADGYMGLSYKSSDNVLTTFQKLVNQSTASDSSSLIFGLDFRSPDNSSSDNKYIDGLTTSSMEMGDVKKEFADSIKWTYSPSAPPSSSPSSSIPHQFFLEGFHFCDNAVSGNYSMNWIVVVNTGSSCLELPSEFYDSFVSWFDNSTIFNDRDDLPAFSFNVSVDGSDRYYIPLGDLLVTASSIEQEVGAPYVQIANEKEEMRVCVLRGSNIENKDKEIYSSPPVITFGSLVLQSLYFSADYASHRVGIANKLSDDYRRRLDMNNEEGCYPSTVCIEDQIFVPSNNNCRDFSCNKYYFMQSGGDTNACQYNTSNLIGGLIFVLLIALLEIVSFFALQHSGRIVVPSNDYQLVDADIDIVTKSCEFVAISSLDYLVTYVLHWVPITQPRTNAIAAENPHEIAPTVVVDGTETQDNDGLVHV